MVNILNIFVAFVIFGLTVGLPIKDEEIDELIYRLQDLKHQNLYDGEDFRKLDGFNADAGGYGMRTVDSIGGGNLLRSIVNYAGRQSSAPVSATATAENSAGAPQIVTRSIDQIGGGNLIRSVDAPRHYIRSLDAYGTGANMIRNLDHIGGAHLLKRTIDSIGGAHLLKRAVDSLGGGYLLK